MHVYCILAPTEGTLDGDMHLEFFIDGRRSGSFDYTGKSVFEYNVPVYVNTSLEVGPRNFTPQNGGSQNQTSLIILDYMIYSWVLSFVVVIFHKRALIGGLCSKSGQGHATNRHTRSVSFSFSYAIPFSFVACTQPDHHR